MALLLLAAANSSSKLSKASTTSAAFKALLLLSSVVFDSFQWWICLTESQNPLKVTNFYFPEFNLLFCGTSQKTKTMFQIFSPGYLNPSLNTWTCFEVHFERMPHNKFVFFRLQKKRTAVVRGMMKLKVNQFVAQIFYGSYWTRSHQVQGLLLTILVPTLITTATPLPVPSKGLKRHQKALSLSISICQVFKSRQKIQVVVGIPKVVS